MPQHGARAAARATETLLLASRRTSPRWSMAPRTQPEREPTSAVAHDELADGDPGRVVRRAPFSANPNVGARGQRTQQRILDAALRVFGEEGYQQCSIDRITKRAGCSRVSFYQYF